jgi:hypothetical protein
MGIFGWVLVIFSIALSYLFVASDRFQYFLISRGYKVVPFPYSALERAYCQVYPLPNEAIVTSDLPKDDLKIMASQETLQVSDIAD